MNNQTVFLAKIQQTISLLDEIDDIITDTPNMQQNIDWEISDYLHLLENEELSEKARLEVDEQLARCRKLRRQINNIFAIGKVFNDNRNKLCYKNQREFLYNNIRAAMNKLDCDYKYRVLDQDTINNYIKNEEVIESTEKNNNKRSYIKHGVTKEQILELMETGMRTKDIAEQLGITPSSLCHMKQKFGINKKKGD